MPKPLNTFRRNFYWKLRTCCAHVGATRPQQAGKKSL